MKAQKKSGPGPYLQRRNNRWKWMAGATAATATGVTASQVNAVTIDLNGNYISGSSGNHLNADLTGDGHPDITIANVFHTRYYRSSLPNTFYYHAERASVDLNGIHAAAFGSGLRGAVQLASRYQHFSVRGSFTPSVYSFTGSISIFFKDLRINSGAPTEGSLTLTVSAQRNPGQAIIQLNSFTYQGSSPTVSAGEASRAVPDHGSSLSLLAMGAGGILAFRRSITAHGRS